MSRANVEIVRTLAEGFQRRQHELAFEFYDPDVEWDSLAFPDHRSALEAAGSRPRDSQD